MLKKLRPRAITPQDLSKKDHIKAGFQELLADLNSIADQWNDTLQPLIDSLPGGRRRLSPAERGQEIDPVLNGFDGSQVFMDQTATPTSGAGFFYNTILKRPKTIKEVVLDGQVSLGRDISKLTRLLEAVDPSNTEYDDTDLRNWIRRLAADTISDLDLGDAFDTGYFGAPTKSLQYSLHQRDTGLRNVIGLDSDDYGLTSPGFSGTNHIDDQDLIEALITLDGLVGGGGGVSNLQEAYDGGNTIEVTFGRPVVLTTSSNTTVPLRCYASVSGGAAAATYGSVRLSKTDATAIGSVGEKAGSDAFHIAAENGVILEIGTETGMSKFQGYHDDFVLSVNALLNFQTPAISDRGMRFFSHSDEAIYGAIQLYDNAFDNGTGASGELGLQIVGGSLAAIGAAPKGTFYWDNSPVLDRTIGEGVRPSANTL